MRSLYLLNLSGHQYAVWKDSVESVKDIAKIHRVPFSPPGIVGLSVVDKRSTALADLAALIGRPPFDIDFRGQLLLVAGQKSDSGFIVPAGISEISIPDGQRLAHWFQPGIALSPDGQALAFFTGDIPPPESRPYAITPQRLMLRHLSQLLLHTMLVMV